MIALKNFLHTLRRYKAATLLNILGLAVAFAAFYILMVQVRFDLNFDRSYPKAECIYQIALPQFYEEGKGYSSFIPRPDGEKAIAASPHIRQGGCQNTRCTIQNKARLRDSTGIPFIKYRTACSKCSGSDA